MKVKILIIFLLNFGCLKSQIIKYPYFEDRDTKLVTLNSVEKTKQYTILELEYLCSYRSDSSTYNIDQNSYLATQSKNYKLLKVENIQYSPNITYCSEKGTRVKFKLFFERIDDTVTEFHLIECPKKNTCFNIYNINVEKSNDDQFDGVLFSNKIKDDKFLGYLDPIMQFVFDEEIFAGHNGNFNNFFEKLIEAKYNKDKLLNLYFEEILFENKVNENVYIFTLKNTSFVKVIELYVKKESNNANRIINSRFYFEENKEIAAQDFFRSFCDYYGYSYDTKDLSKGGMHIFPKSNSWININKFENLIPIVSVSVLTDEEYKDLLEKK